MLKNIGEKKEKKMSKSEFGKGLVVCLAKFYAHFENSAMEKIWFYHHCLKETRKDQERIMSDDSPEHLKYGRNFNQSFKFWMKEIVPIHSGNTEEALSGEIILWANGATDHLYEIETPEGMSSDIRKIIEELKDKGLDMGHGKGLMGQKMYTLKDVEELQGLAEKALLLIDEKLGLKPDWGEY